MLINGKIAFSATVLVLSPEKKKMSRVAKKGGNELDNPLVPFSEVTRTVLGVGVEPRSLFTASS